MQRRLSIIALAAVAFVAAPGTARAHVTVNPSEAGKGSFAKLAFRVPNERPDSGTVKVEILFPSDLVVRSLRTRPQAGWTATVQKRKLDQPLEAEGGAVTETVSKITWQGGSIGPDQFDEFEVSLGPLPETGEQIVFPAIQTYESGEVVKWDEPPLAGGEEPERPAPVLTLVAGSGEGGAAGGGTDEETTEGEATGGSEEPAAESTTGGEVAAADTASQDDVDSARTLGIAGLVVGLLGLAAGGSSFLMRRRQA